ncbi:MAG: MerR family transcriptional regulator [Clostridium sp.]|uniref:MerR family transcriptional regulator n=1 Tax=Clostridium sp. TaxID=1506 RepID=UPI002FC73C97
MSKKIISFKEACKITGYKASAIRYYEKEFFLTIPRDENDRRIFTEKEIDTLLYIKELQVKGYSNPQIKAKMEGKDGLEEVAASVAMQPPISTVNAAGFVKELEDKLQEISKSLCELSETVNETVTSKERDLIISENMRLKMENKKKEYELLQLKEKLELEERNKKGIFSMIFSRK